MFHKISHVVDSNFHSNIYIIDIKNIYRIYITIDKMVDIMEDMKQNITDHQSKTIIDSLMEISKPPREKMTIIKVLYLCVYSNGWTQSYK